MGGKKFAILSFAIYLRNGTKQAITNRKS